MRVAAGQFVVTPDWPTNAGTCVLLMQQAAAQQASLLVLPEALLARDDNDPDMSVKSAQGLDGGFLRLLLDESRRNAMTTVLTVHVPTREGRAANTLVALRGGEIIAQYQKLHLYDAFNIQESKRVDAGKVLPPLIEVDGMKVGLMTCYDLRFPEMALAQALQGAEVLVLPTAWVRGPLKEHHWATLLAARSLDTTCYIVAAGECGNKNIGQSRIVDPLGVTLAGAGGTQQLIYADVSRAILQQIRAQLPVLNNRRFAPPQIM
ncbi:deaminated glutathione amidase [Scandinavium sp. V105_16]|uniref:Deaminated glutathione amidase n=1 Tax=Scandinavium lactucae TaxID=3095028 RepID=A0AAJ2S568_9ENTR|nr:MULTISPECIES: deaminated glutathione amidase [unclassified Scandinavium]MDX6018710.1 deaminated glutathione amidase [Scandinavium sp. V105_16]MDX6030329.1 deaminated glutathione amidase [Scandinavium sp. V105_12]